MRTPPKPTITLDGGSFHSEEATAELLGISRATLSLWRKNKEGPGHCQVAQSTYYPETTLRAWLETQARNCHDEPEQALNPLDTLASQGIKPVACHDGHDHDWKLMEGGPAGGPAAFKCETCGLMHAEPGPLPGTSALCEHQAHQWRNRPHDRGRHCVACGLTQSEKELDEMPRSEL